MNKPNLPALIDNAKTEFSKLLPSHISPEMFARTAQTAVALTRNIEKVQNPKSLLIACSKAAADGLILDGREAALIIDFRGDVRYQPMMRGLLKLAYNSDQVSSINVQAVYENDHFEYILGDQDEIIHKVNLREDRGEIFAVYAVANLTNGSIIREVMTTKQVNSIRNRSDAWKAYVAKKIKATPWLTDWEEMARKTVFRRLSKYIPSSTEKDRLTSASERVDEDYDFVSETADVQISVPKKKKRGAGAAALKTAVKNTSEETDASKKPTPKQEDSSENPAPQDDKPKKIEPVNKLPNDDI